MHDAVNEFAISIFFINFQGEANMSDEFSDPFNKEQHGTTKTVTKNVGFAGQQVKMLRIWNQNN